MKSWSVAHHMTLMTIADTPHSIALGSAIGIFSGFTPLYPLKTLLSIAVAWIFRCNKVAAAIAVTLHDVLIWAMPAIYLVEYQSRLLDYCIDLWRSGTFRQFRLQRLRALACVFGGRLAHLLARVYWFALLFHSFGYRCLFSHAVAHQPRQGYSDDSIRSERVVLNEGLSMESAFRPGAVRCEERREGRRRLHSTGLEWVTFQPVDSVCESECAD